MTFFQGVLAGFRFIIKLISAIFSQPLPLAATAGIIAVVIAWDLKPNIVVPACAIGLFIVITMKMKR